MQEKDIGYRIQEEPHIDKFIKLEKEYFEEKHD
jgi:hypothetical protein